MLLHYTNVSRLHNPDANPESPNLWILENRKVIRVMGDHLEKHTLSGLDEIPDHTGMLSITAINHASSLRSGPERL